MEELSSKDHYGGRQDPSGISCIWYWSCVLKPQMNRLVMWCLNKMLCLWIGPYFHTDKRNCNGIFYFYATAASAMRWHIAIHLCVFVCVLYRLYSELKKSSCEKPLVQFQPNLAGLFLGWRASKVVQRISFHAEIWLPWQPKGIIRINLKNLLVKTQKA